MEETVNLKSIVLSRQDFKENDVLVTFYSREKGKFNLVARGAKKLNSKLAGHIEPLSFVDLMIVKGRQYDYVGSVKNIESFIKIKNDLLKTEVSLKILKIFKDQVKENDADDDLYFFLCRVLFFLNENKDIDLDFLNNFFIFKLMAIMGYEFELNNCVKCKTKISPGINYLHISQGGVFCGHCGDKKNNLTISDNSIKMLKLAINSDIEHLFKIKIDNKLNKEFESIVSSLKKYFFN